MNETRSDIELREGDDTGDDIGHDNGVDTVGESTERTVAVWRVLTREIFQVVLPAAALALAVHLFLAQATVVYGQSMEPSLFQNQRLIVDKISYRLNSPQRDDIIVLDLPNMDELLVKRIIGLPGETIEIAQGVIYVDSEPLEETFPHHMINSDMAPVTLGALSYFVLGDNRGNSNDSRSFGSVNREDIIGRVWLRYWPLDDLTFF